MNILRESCRCPPAWNAATRVSFMHDNNWKFNLPDWLEEVRRITRHQTTCFRVNDYLIKERRTLALCMRARLCKTRIMLLSRFKLNNIIYNVPTLAIHRLNVNFITKSESRRKKWFYPSQQSFIKGFCLLPAGDGLLKTFFLYFQITQNLFYNISCFSLNLI